MTDIDEFASNLLEQAKALLEAGSRHSNSSDIYFHGALLLGFSALEAHVNAISDECVNTRKLNITDQAVLKEKEIKLDRGIFKLGSDKIYRLEDRILFLQQRFGVTPVDRKASWWSDLSLATQLRNKLTHPRAVPIITLADIERALKAIINALDAIFRSLYKRPFPSAARGLNSKILLP